MNRLFGKAKPKVPAPTLDDASKSMESRGGVVDEKIAKLDEELNRYKKQLQKMKPGAAKQQVQQRALRVLKQKKKCMKNNEIHFIINNLMSIKRNLLNKILRIRLQL